MKSQSFRASSLSRYDSSTLYTTLPHNLTTDKLVDLIERLVQRECSLILHAMIGLLSLHLMQSEIITYGLVRKFEALTFLLDNICIRICSKLYTQTVGFTMDTNCAPLVADLFFCSVMRETSCCPF